MELVAKALDVVAGVAVTATEVAGVVPVVTAVDFGENSSPERVEFDVVTTLAAGAVLPAAGVSEVGNDGSDVVPAAVVVTACCPLEPRKCKQRVKKNAFFFFFFEDSQQLSTDSCQHQPKYAENKKKEAKKTSEHERRNSATASGFL